MGNFGEDTDQSGVVGGSRFTKRSLLRFLAVSALGAAFEATLGAVVNATSPWVSGSPSGILVGEVKESDGSQMVVAMGEGHVTVTLATGGLCYREGLVGLADFQPGDEVVMEGTQAGQSVRATMITRMFRIATGRVKLRDGAGLQLEGEGKPSDIRITPRTKPARSPFGAGIEPSAIKVGDVIAVMGPVDEKGTVLTALRVSAGRV